MKKVAGVFVEVAGQDGRVTVTGPGAAKLQSTLAAYGAVGIQAVEGGFSMTEGEALSAKIHPEDAAVIFDQLKAAAQPQAGHAR